jgi:penicillin amidase
VKYEPASRYHVTFMNRLVRYINIGIAIVLVVALAATFWYAWRPLPQTSGTIRAMVAQKVAAARDVLGVPHISAASLDDALFVQGFVTAQDRLWQMDGLRRLAAGDLAEIIGQAALTSDRESRRLRMRRIAEQQYISLPAKERAALAAYARGVNFFLDTYRGRYPIEFTLLQYEPRPWSGVDTLLIGLHMFRTLTATWKDEITKRNMLAGGDAAKVGFLFSMHGGGDIQPGSNAWALAGSRTASGKPLLSSDPHLEWSLPGIWYMVHLSAPGLNVSGVSLPGVPGVIIGHNERIAWGVTNLQFDVQDLYVEKFNDNTGQYLFRGQVEQARAERELIRVRNSTPLEEVVWVTRHGPLFVTEGRERMSLRWMAAEPAIEFPFLDMDRARNWQEFTAALARYAGPPQNFVYADVDGNIGYHAAGKLPIRKGFAGDVPVDGSSGDYEWQGVIPFDQLPSFYNPPQGLIVTANQNPFPVNYPHPVNGNFAPPYRAQQIRDRLLSRNGWRAEDLLTVQKDVYSGFTHYLARSVVAAYEHRKARNPRLDDAIALLRQWNGQMEKDETAPLIVSLAYQHLRRMVTEKASPGYKGTYEFPMAPAVLEDLLRARPAGWFNDYDELLVRALSDGVEEGRRMQGDEVRKWKYGDYLRLLINHPVLHNLPLVGKYFDIGPVRMSGSATTPKQTTSRLGPSMRFDADLADWERSWLNITTGQSGHALSGHYKDQWNPYYEGRSFPMQFGRVAAKDVLEFLPAR